MTVPFSAPAAAGTVTPTSTCYYNVVVDQTAVRENPDTNSVVRKYKYRGELVTGPCQRVLDTESGVYFTAVNCSCATDGIGWIRSSHLA
ncbi:MAG TPA: hypothetical protein VGD67_22530 [Pseudonocardiaceae bacterium]